MLKKIIFFFTFLIINSSAVVLANVVTVGLIQGEPPVSFFNNNQPTGIAYDLFKQVASKQNIKITVVPVDSEKQGYAELASKRIDVLAGAVSPSLSHNQADSFSLPFMVDSVTVATKHSLVSFSRLYDELNQTLFWDIMLVALLGQFLFSFILWLTERTKHQEFMSRGVLTGIGYANWAILSAFLRDLIFEPKTTSGRLVMGSWLVASVVFMTVLASSVTVSIVNISSVYHSPIKKAADLRNVKVGVHSHDSLIETINKLGVRAVPEKTESALISNLASGQYKAVIDNSIMLDYYLARHPDLPVGLTGLTLRTNYFSYVLRKNDPLISHINHGLIEAQSGLLTKNICEQYLDQHIHECAL